MKRCFFDINPHLKTLHELKEKYIDSNTTKYESKEEVESSLNHLINTYDKSKEVIFHDFSLFLKRHKEEIINSFVTLLVNRKTKKEEDEYYARLSNRLMESFNRKPKDYKRSTRDSYNFDYIHNRFLWALQSNLPILGTLKSNDEIHGYKLHKSIAN